MQRRNPNWPCTFRTKKGPMHGIEETHRLCGPFPKIASIGLERHDPLNVDIPKVHWRMAFHNPVSHHFADSTPRYNTDGIKSGCHKKIIKFRRWTQHIAIVWGKTFGPVKKCLYPGSGKQWNSLHRKIELRLDMLDILRQSFELEIFRDT